MPGVQSWDSMQLYNFIINMIHTVQSSTFSLRELKYARPKQFQWRLKFERPNHLDNLKQLGVNFCKIINIRTSWRGVSRTDAQDHCSICGSCGLASREVRWGEDNIYWTNRELWPCIWSTFRLQSESNLLVSSAWYSVIWVGFRLCKILLPNLPIRSVWLVFFVSASELSVGSLSLHVRSVASAINGTQ